MQDNPGNAIAALKAAKAQNLSYFDASQSLLKQGFTQEELEQASYQFPYTEIPQPSSINASSDPSLNQAFAEGVVHEEALDNAMHALPNHIGMALTAA